MIRTGGIWRQLRLLIAAHLIALANALVRKDCNANSLKAFVTLAQAMQDEL
jgi:hypothetical protein